MSKSAVRSTSVFLALLALSGCRNDKWGDPAWYGRESTVADIAAARTYMRSVALYGQLSTDAVFDVLPLSNQVRTTFASLYAQRRGKGAVWRDSVLRKELARNKRCIAFYIVTLREVLFGEHCGEWCMTLSVDGRRYQPASIRATRAIPVEYKHIFGRAYAPRFKVPYEVIFYAHDEEGKPLVRPDTNSMTLYIRSDTGKEASVSWDIGPSGITFGG